MNDPQQPATLLVTQDEAAHFLRVDRTTIWRMWKRGDLDTVTVGSRRHVTWASLVNYVESQTERC